MTVRANAVEGRRGGINPDHRRRVAPSTIHETHAGTFSLPTNGNLAHSYELRCSHFAPPRVDVGGFAAEIQGTCASAFTVKGCDISRIRQHDQPRI